LKTIPCLQWLLLQTTFLGCRQLPSKAIYLATMSSQVNDFTWRPSTAKKMHSTNKEMQQAFIIHQNMILEPILQKTNAL
jgi:hypothetical protein